MTDLELIEIIQKLNTFTDNELQGFQEITINEGLKKYVQNLLYERSRNKHKETGKRFSKPVVEKSSN